MSSVVHGVGYARDRKLRLVEELRLVGRRTGHAVGLLEDEINLFDLLLTEVNRSEAGTADIGLFGAQTVDAGL